MTHSAKAFPVHMGVLILAMILLFGCVPKGEVYRVKPPKVGWKGIRDVAVLGFDGPYGENLRRQVCDRLTEYSEIKEVAVIYGEYDAIVKVQTDNMKTLDNFITERLRALPNIFLTATMLIAKQYK